jgi:xylan 1,4-beta-xylosidase
MSVLAPAAMVTTAALAVLAAPAAAATRESATVDFARPVRDQPSMVGLLHGMDGGSPPDGLVTPLRPALWRGIPRTVAFGRAMRAGADPMVVLSDAWGYPDSNWHGHGPPYADPGRWTKFIRQAARRAGTATVVWDVWNEPDSGAFWTGTPEELAATFAIAEHTLRAELGARAIVVGPSFAHYDLGWMRRFLDACLPLACRIDALTWHEFPKAHQPIDAIASHLREARRELVDAPRYRPLAIRSLIVNEMVSRDDQRRPGELVAYFAALERGGAAGAARACFPLAPPSNGCNDDTLDGLLTPAGSVRTTASWWVTQAYSDGVGRRVRTTSTAGGLAAIADACASPATPATVLLGSGRRGASRARDWHVRLTGLRRLPCARRAHRLSVQVQAIPYVGSRPLGKPATRPRQQLPIRDGAATIRIARVRPHEAIVLRLSAGARGSRGARR